MTQPVKKCRSCHATKPATPKHFNADRRYYDGLTADCADCIGDKKPVNSSGQYRKKKIYFSNWHRKNQRKLASIQARLVRFDETG